MRQTVIFISAFSDLERKKKKGLHLNLVRRKYPKLGPFLKEREREKKKKISSFNIINMSSQMRIVSVI